MAEAEAPSAPDDALSRKIAATLLGSKGGMIPVYDPDSNSLRALPESRAREMQDAGYSVGSEAQAKALQNSKSAQLGAFLTSAGQWGSAGLLNAGLAATRQKGALVNEQRAQEANPIASGAGSLAGIVGSSVAGPLRFGGIGARALGAAEAKGGLTYLLARGADVALAGAPAMAAVAASDTLAQNAILDRPTTAQQVAASALEAVAWNGLLGAGLHGLGKAPKAFVSAGRNVVDHLENWGLLKARYSVDAEATAAANAGPKVSAKTQVFEREYPSEATVTPQAAGTTTDRQLAQMAGDDGAALSRTQEALGNVQHPSNPDVGLPSAAAQILEEPLSHRIAAPPELEPVPKVESLGMKNAREKAAKLASAADEAERAAEAARPQLPEDFDPVFEYEKGYTKPQKLHVVRDWTKEVLGGEGSEGLAKWDKIKELENEATALRQSHDADIKGGGTGIVGIDKIEQAKWAEKAALKKQLASEYPRVFDKEAGTFTPGFADLNAEYDNILHGGKGRAELERPEFIDKNQRAFDAAETAHRNAAARADEAEANAKKLEAHHQALEDRAAAIERNRAKTAAAKAEETAMARADREAARARAKAEAAAAKVARDEARATAKAARDAEKAAAKAKALAEKQAKQAAMPGSSKANPKSVRSEKYSIDSETAEGLRRDTVERREANGKIKEKHRVVIKAPKTPPKLKFDGYEMPFHPSTISNVGLGGHFTGASAVTTPLAVGMTGANIAAKVLSHRTEMAKQFLRFTEGVGRLSSPVLKLGGRAMVRAANQQNAGSNHSPEDYQAVVKAVSYLDANPEVIQGQLARRYPGLAAANPQLHQAVGLTMQRAVEALNEQIPKRPYDPTLQDTEFTPTRAQQVKVMRQWKLLSNPHLAVELADPDTIRLLERAYPDLVREHRQELMAKIHAAKGPILGRTARQISTYLGANIRPIDEAAALKRLQETAGPEPMQQAGGQKGAGGGHHGGASAKITNQAVQRDLPDADFSQLGG